MWIILLIIGIIIQVYKNSYDKKEHKRLEEIKVTGCEKITINDFLLFNKHATSSISSYFIMLFFAIALPDIAITYFPDHTYLHIASLVVTVILVLAFVILSRETSQYVKRIVKHKYEVKELKVINKEVIKGKKFILKFEGDLEVPVDYQTYQTINESCVFYILDISPYRLAFDSRYYKLEGSE